ncbi:ParH-like protein [Nocardia sp. ET3-3]|uniref:ParH-like protein n=1 Tax=Nocardia terrae TaxID=2675851 RepID=A0A7K1V3Y7_9NOCA|nr:ImmA/IrrE family metallo-endopeptidase [Nocardia terrae]MVU81335.1 ParH-like protein [Nocardia terrae]
MRLDEYGIRIGDSLTDVQAKIATAVSREIQLIPFPLGSGTVHGLLLSTDLVDYVVFEENTTELHRAHIILHEFAHIIFGHYQTSDSRSLTDEIASLLPELGAGRAALLGRDVYDSPQEIEAELMATILGDILNNAATQEYSLQPAVADDERVNRILQTFGIHERF